MEHTGNTDPAPSVREPFVRCPRLDAGFGRRPGSPSAQGRDGGAPRSDPPRVPALNIGSCQRAGPCDAGLLIELGRVVNALPALCAVRGTLDNETFRASAAALPRCQTFTYWDSRRMPDIAWRAHITADDQMARR